MSLAPDELLLLQPVIERIQSGWVRSSVEEQGVALKLGCAAEFGLAGFVHNPRKFAVRNEDLSLVQRAIRHLYVTTQDALAEKGILSIDLFRGLSSRVFVAGIVESWTIDDEIARRYDGYDVLKETILRERILMWSHGPMWNNGPGGEESEYVVLSDKPR